MEKKPADEITYLKTRIDFSSKGDMAAEAAECSRTVRGRCTDPGGEALHGNAPPRCGCVYQRPCSFV